MRKSVAREKAHFPELHRTPEPYDEKDTADTHFVVFM